MTKRSSKKVLSISNISANQSDALSITNNNTTNFNVLSSINSPIDSTSSQNATTFTKSKENCDVIIQTDNDVNNNQNSSQSILYPQITNKRKISRVKNSRKRKKIENSSNNETTTTIDLDNDSIDIEVDNDQPELIEISDVWKYATRTRDKNFAICSICTKRISTSNWSTTCLRRHLILKHDKYDLVLPNDKRKAISTINPQDKEKFDKLSVEAIIKDSLPFNAFMKPGLSKLIKAAIPGYQPIHRNVVTRRLKRLNQQKYNKLIEELKRVENIAISMDYWSDRSNRSFLVITGHFHTDNHQQKMKILSFCSFELRHTSDSIANFVYKKLQQLHIVHKVNRIVTDGARNISNAVTSMGLNADRIWCVAHRLHLTVTNGLGLWPKKSKKAAGASNNQDLQSYPNLNNLTISNIEQQLLSKEPNINEINLHDQSNNNNHSNNDYGVVEEHLLIDNDNDESVITNGGNEVQNDQEDDDSEDDFDYENDEDIEYNDNGGYDGNNDNHIDGNISNSNDDNNDNYNDTDTGGSKNDIINDDDNNNRDKYVEHNSFEDYNNIVHYIEEEILDCWSENIEIDPNDPLLTKEQTFTLFLMIKCRRLINMIRKSSVLTLYFNQQRNILHLKRNLLRDVCTRWNSTFLMIHSLIITRPVIQRVYNNKHNLNITHEQIEKLNELEITTTEWNYLKQLHCVLKVFHQATKTVSGQNYPTMGYAFFILTKLKKFLMDDKNDNPIVKNFKKLLLIKIIQYFEEDRIQLNILKFQSFFDPTGYQVLSDVDKRSIECDIKQIYENDLTSLHNPSSLSSSSISRLNNPGTFSTTSKTTTTTSTNLTASSSKSNTKKKRTSMEIFLESIGEDTVLENDTRTRALIVEELYTYRSLMNKYNSKNKPNTTSCLLFWRTYEFTLPYLFTLAKRYICTPATSVAAEGAFSTASYIARRERSRLSLKNLEATIFLKDKFEE